MNDALAALQEAKGAEVCGCGPGRVRKAGEEEHAHPWHPCCRWQQSTTHNAPSPPPPGGQKHKGQALPDHKTLSPPPRLPRQKATSLALAL